MQELAGILPQDVFRLTIRINLQSLRDLKLRRKNQAALSQWIKTTAPELKITPEGRGRTRRIDWTSIEDFPFQVSLRRYEPVVKPYFIINYFIDDDIEKARLPRIHRACAEHFGKLAVWQQEAKARAVLILEDNDLSLTNEHLVIEALASVEESIPNPPDEMYLVNTEIDSMWHMRCLRDGSKRHL
jgi:hypothetical protein